LGTLIVKLKSSGTDSLYSSTVFFSGSFTISNKDQNPTYAFTNSLIFQGKSFGWQALIYFNRDIMLRILFEIIYLAKFRIDYSFPGIVFPAAGAYK